MRRSSGAAHAAAVFGSGRQCGVSRSVLRNRRLWRFLHRQWQWILPFDGRFSDGLVWIDYVAGNLSLPLYDYAVGGATTSNALVQGYTGPGSTIPVPSVDEQVKDFLSASPSGAAPLFVLLSGANDVLFNINITAAQSFAHLSQSVEQLRQSYPAAHILLLNYPSLSHLPYAYYASSSDKSSLSAYSASLASLLRSNTDASAPYAQTTTFVDLAPLFADFDYYAEPAAYGFEAPGAYGSCLVGAYGEVGDGVVEVCAEGFGVRVWMDEYHPTTRAHGWIARTVLDALV